MKTITMQEIKDYLLEEYQVHLEFLREENEIPDPVEEWVQDMGQEEIEALWDFLIIYWGFEKI